MPRLRDVSAPWHDSPTGQAAALALTIAAFTWAWLGVGVEPAQPPSPTARPTRRCR